MAIACVQWDMFDAGHQAAWNQGPIKIYRLGYFWWQMDGYMLELQYIRFAQQIFLPPNNLVNAYSWQLEEGVTGTFNHTYTKLNELPVDVIGQGIGMAIGQVDGLRKLTQTGLDGPIPQITKRGNNQRLRGYVSNR